MNTPLPEEYVAQMFMMYAGYPKRKPSGIFEGGCPICREGKSWGVKRRCFYIPDYNNIHCKNCNNSWSPFNWIKQVTGKTATEIRQEAKDYEYVPIEIIERKTKPKFKNALDKLPQDSIDLFDPTQVNFYKNNKVVIECIRFLRKRRLDRAINRPRSLYVSLVDKLHKNRLCIPFINQDNHISFYQTRTVMKTKTLLPKYIGQKGGEKGVFGIDRVTADLDYIFIFEGPIDSMFVTNGVAVGGVDLSVKQKKELDKFPFHTKIWVLDNQHIDQTAKDVTYTLLKNGELVFLWDKVNAKDFNDVCILKKVNQIPVEYIIKNSYTGLAGLMRLKKLGL